MKRLAHETKFRTLASAKGLVMSNTKNIPVSTRNIAPTMYAVGVVKYAFVSFHAIVIVLFNLQSLLCQPGPVHLYESRTGI